MHSTNILSYICIYLAFLNALPSNCASSSEAPFVFDPKAQITDAVAQQIHAQYPAFHGLAQEDLNKRLIGLIDSFYNTDPKETICKTIALIQAGADAKATGQFGDTALIRAVECDARNFTEYLLHKGANIMVHRESWDYPAYFHCSTINMLHKFVQHGIKIDVNATNSVTMLIDKIGDESVKINMFRFLIHCGAKINQTDSFGHSALTFLAIGRSCSHDSSKIARLLLDAGAERDHRVKLGHAVGVTADQILKKINGGPLSTDETRALQRVLTSYIPPLYNRAFYTLLAATHSTDPAVAERAKQDMNVLKSAHAHALRPEFHEPTD